MPTFATTNRRTCAVYLTSALLGLTGSALLSSTANAQAPAAPDAAVPATAMPAPAPAAPDATAPAATTVPDTTAPTTTVAPEASPLPPAPEPETHSSSRFRIGPTIGFYLPSSSKVRDRFGSTWFSVGLGIGPVTGVSTKGSVGLDLNLQYQSHDSNHVLLVPVGVGYRVALSNSPDTRTVPYAGLTADLVVVNVKSNPDNVNSTELTGGGSALIGLNFGNSANIEARYQLISGVKTFGFSGLDLDAGYRF